MDYGTESPSSPMSSPGSLAPLDKAQSELKDALDELWTWKASLPFEDVLGFGDRVDLFDFIGENSTINGVSIIKFDPQKWPPTPEGLKACLKALQAIAIQYGTTLRRNGNGVLICNHGIGYRDNFKKQPESEREFDDKGVMTDHRGKRLHNDRLSNRRSGQRKRRASSTTKDVTGVSRCKLRLTLKIGHDDENSGGFIFLRGTGNPFHTHHPKPENGTMAMPRRFSGDDTINLIRGG